MADGNGNRSTVGELQAKCSALELERRMWKARAKATMDVLKVFALELPVMHRLIGTGTGVEVEDVLQMLRQMGEVGERIDLLERDAWTTNNKLIRKFIAEAAPYEKEGYYPHGFVDEWVKKFQAALPPE